MSKGKLAEKTITEMHEIHIPLSDKQKVELFEQVIEANKKISRLEEEKKAFNDDIKSKISEQMVIISDACGNAENGFKIKTMECIVKYDNGNTVFVDIKTGEKVDEHPTTEEEQMRLNNPNIIDAEQIIREASKEEDE